MSNVRIENPTGFLRPLTGRDVRHDKGLAKAYCSVTIPGGVVTISEMMGMTSVVDNGVGDTIYGVTAPFSQRPMGTVQSYNWHQYMLNQTGAAEKTHTRTITANPPMTYEDTVNYACVIFFGDLAP